MKYMGSKNRIAKHLKPFLEKHLNGDNYYIEPFVGGANMIDKIDYNKRIGADYNEYLVAMWQGLQQNKDRPKVIDKEFYSKIREEYNKLTKIDCEPSISSVDLFLIGWVGFMASYNGRFFDGGYSGHCVGKDNRDYINEQIRNTEKQSSLIKDVTFVYSSYNNLKIERNSVVYCDIPYKNTKQYSTSKDFSHSDFWEWCREQVKEGNYVYISEYNAPDDFIKVWEKEVTNSLNTTKTYKATEKLFVHKSQYQEALLV